MIDNYKLNFDLRFTLYNVSSMIYSQNLTKCSDKEGYYIKKNKCLFSFNQFTPNKAIMPLRPNGLLMVKKNKKES